ncbi:MAG TPA: glycosyltransferase family 2 protein [Solirubrobacterales bacterium]|nr:glycosyltransferase family 2 protein [Solirubrobacterales bacterium]
MADEGGLGIAVLAYGGGGEFRPLIASLEAEGVPASAIVLVHNQAAPGEAPPGAPEGVEVIATGANPGYAGGMNVGVRRQLERGVEQILVLTHDARLHPGALAALRSAAASAPRFGILGPALVLAGTDVPFSFGGFTDAGGANSHRKELPAGGGEVLACDWVDGGTMLVQRQVFERVGEFDERFWGYCEEADLCLRARRAGFEVGVVPAARADQEPGMGKRIGAWAYLITRNGIEYAGRARGLRGVVTSTLRALRVLALNLLRAGLRRTHLRPGSAAEPWALAVGTWRGIVDRFRGNWGAPPSDLPGLGDLRNA